MKRKRAILIVLGLLVVGGLATFVVYDPNARVQGWAGGEPFYQGRSATSWRRALQQPDEVAVTATRDALAGGKAEAVPVLAWLLGHAADGQVRWRAAEALGRMGKEVPEAGPPLVTALRDPDPLVRGVAVQAVGKLAPTVPGAVPALAETFPDIGAMDAVAEFKADGAEAVPKLIPLLRHEDSKVRWKAARTIGKIGPSSAAAIPELIAVMGGDPDPLVREHCAEALGDIGPAAAEAVPALAKALRDPDAKVRRDAVRSLGQIGPAARPVLAEVAGMANDPEPRVRDAAARSVRQIDPAAPPKK